MRVVLLAGGRGSRLQEETHDRPKPMVDIGGRPILQHIMQRYADFGHRDFTVALGYLGDAIKRHFAGLAAHSGDLRIDLGTGRTTRLGDPETLDWRVDLIDTGLATMTGGRIRRLREQLTGGTFLLTYGDGLADIDVDALVAFHRAHGRLATVTAVRPPARFGAIELDGARVSRFVEKPVSGAGWINGGFFVLEPAIIDLIDGDDTVWEQEPLRRLAEQGDLMAFRHDGFFQPMDTVRDRDRLRALWEERSAPWIVRPGDRKSS